MQWRLVLGSLVAITIAVSAWTGPATAGGLVAAMDLEGLQALTGGQLPPRRLEDAGAVIDFPARHAGAIANVRLDALESSGNFGVKAVALSQQDEVVRPSQSGHALTYRKP